MYKVIKFFTDLQDGSHPYKVGDTYPRKGVNVSQKRIDELLSNKNRQGASLIAIVDEDTPREEIPVDVSDSKPNGGRRGRRKNRKNEE